MKVKMMPTVSSYDLEEAIKQQYDLDVDIPTLLFPEDFMNDCFKEYAYKDTREDEFCESEELCGSTCAMCSRSMRVFSSRFLGN